MRADDEAHEQDLELLDQERRFFLASKVYRRPDGATFTEWSENHLILFDHYREFELFPPSTPELTSHWRQKWS